MWKYRGIYGVKGSNEEIKSVFGGWKEMQRVSIWWANTLPHLCIWMYSCKHAFSKFQKFSKLISNLSDKIYDALSMISNSSLAYSLATLPHSYLFECPNANIHVRNFKISKLSFNTIGRAYAALTTMFNFLPVGLDHSFNFESLTY